MDEPDFFKDCVKKLLKFPIQYTIGHLSDQNQHHVMDTDMNFSQHALCIKVPELGVTVNMKCDPNPSLYDVKKRLIEKLATTCKAEDIYLYQNAKLLSGTNLQTGHERQSDKRDLEAVIRHFMPDEFWTELEGLLKKYKPQSAQEIVPKFKALAKETL